VFRRAITLIALLFAPAAAAAALPTAVTIEATPAVVTFGESTELSGVVSPPAAAGVSVSTQTCSSAPRPVRLAPPLTLRSSSDGTWSTTVTPLVRTTYLAKSGTVTSTPLTVEVRPRLTLTKVGKHGFHVHLAAAVSFDGKLVSFQRLTRFGWRTVKTVMVLWSDSASDAITADRSFRSGIAPRELVRALLPVGQAGDCYTGGSSNTIRS
jgi:hypothetical protein